MKIRCVKNVAGTIILFMIFGSSAESQQSSGISILNRAAVVHPLDSVVIGNRHSGTIVVRDSKGREYVRLKTFPMTTFQAGGALGKQCVLLLDAGGRAIDSAAFRVEAFTGVSDGGEVGELFTRLHDGMMAAAPNGYDEVSWNGKTYRMFVSWVLDNNNTMKGMKYFSPLGGDLVDMLRQVQKPDGMIWSFVGNKMPDSSYFRTAYSSLGYFQRDGDQWFVRQPVENHVEYNYVNMIHQYWMASGDDAWMKRNLQSACRALDYSITDTLRWSRRFGLLKRPYCIDSWDFQVDDQYTPPAPLSPTMVIVPGKTKYGVFFGDNTGYYEACDQLANMLDHAGDTDKASLYRQRRKEIFERLSTLSWNGKFFTHFIEDDSTVKRDLGVDEKSQIAQGNMYSLNRGLPYEMNAAIIRTYMDLRSKLPQGSPGEWYSIYPPFERGFGRHNEKWQYMNGGVAGHAIGELARGAYENGFEDYASKTLKRLHDLVKSHDNHLYFAYTGSIPSPPPPPHYRTVDISRQTNMDLWDQGDSSTLPWMDGERSAGNDMRGLPTGDHAFHGITFHVIDPAMNQRRAVVAVSTQRKFSGETEIPVNDTASSVYLLHASSDNIPSHVAGAITFEYGDGTEVSKYLIKGKDITNWWFPILDNQTAGVAWSGPNPRSTRVGVCWTAIDNPFPQKQIRAVKFQSSLEGGMYVLIGMTLSDRQHYVPPQAVSYGGPDNWAAATGMAAIIEGLAGVSAEKAGFGEARLAPRWPSYPVDSADVSVVFPASDGYVAYRYFHLPNRKEIRLLVTGSGKMIHAHVLLPKKAAAVESVVVNDQPVHPVISGMGVSKYVDFTMPLPMVQKVTIRYQE
jgi:hypothetical protein